MNLSFQKTKKWAKRWLPTPWKHHHQPCVFSKQNLHMEPEHISFPKAFEHHWTVFLLVFTFFCFWLENASSPIGSMYGIICIPTCSITNQLLFSYLTIPYMHPMGVVYCVTGWNQRIFYPPEFPLHSTPEVEEPSPPRRSWSSARRGLFRRFPGGPLVEGCSRFEPKHVRKGDAEKSDISGFSCEWWREDSKKGIFLISWMMMMMMMTTWTWMTHTLKELTPFQEGQPTQKWGLS